ncbi:MAG: hypothetical protein WAX89_01085 [Alphaproteobacteria bacterium]
MLVTTPEARTKVKEYLKQAAQTQLRIQSEQADLRDILKVLNEEFEIKPTLARKVLKIMDKGNVTEIKEATDNLFDLYEITVTAH